MVQTPSPQQLKAIESDDGPVLVLAGPGAGKTFCIIERIRFLVAEMGFEPTRICAVTFTNKAAEEIAIRLKEAIGQSAEDVTRGTLHSLCLTVLREFPAKVGLNPGFGVADDAYQSMILRRLDVWPVKRHPTLLNLFSRRRRDGRSLSPDDEKLFVRYIAFLRSKNMVDFEDIVSLTREALAENQDVVDAVAGRWDCLLVDEFQDLSRPQYDVIKMLGQEHQNVFGVGDDDQSIFSWAGADPMIISHFQKDFEIANPVVLDENRRCTRQIFEAARNLLRANPQLFDKELVANREGEFEVEVRSFPTEIDEGNWLAQDIGSEGESAALDWGDFAILYRKHSTGADLERTLLKAGIPCRLARGRALSDDRVISFVLGSLRLMLAGDDSLVIEGFAANMLPPELMETLRALRPGPSDGFLDVLRTFARSRRGDLDSKKVWRLVYHVENMQGLLQSHSNLKGLVGDLLSHMRGPYRNKLEEHQDDLSDPAEYPGAFDLAARIGSAIETKSRIWLSPMGGLEIGLLGLFIQSGTEAVCGYLGSETTVAKGDLVISNELVNSGTLATLVFKALQLIASRNFDVGLRDFVSFDLETTDKDIDECEVVEIGAVRVRGGEVVERFQRLVKPERSISQRAQEVHGYSADDLVDASRFNEVWPEFRQFFGSDLLVAHNGHGFDVPVVRRMTAPFDNLDGVSFFDTLPLARSLFESSASLEALADRFGIDKGRAHHADDDAETLAQVVGKLNSHKLALSRKCGLSNALDFLGLSLALSPKEGWNSDDRRLKDLSYINALGRYSDCLDFYQLQSHGVPGGSVQPVEDVIKELGGEGLRRKLRDGKSPADRYPQSVRRLTNLVEVSECDTVIGGIERMLEKAALSTSVGIETDPHRVNLLTLHSTKGLEFSRVYVVGVEDNEMPGWREVKENNTSAIQEARRLVYVGMTRAKDRLVLTRTDERFGNFTGGGMFVDEIGINVIREETAVE
jgi:DNA polymerase III epsilon subunit family exonuclease